MWDGIFKMKMNWFHVPLGFFFLFRPEIDDDGVIEPDTDEPQEMGDFEIVEVSFFWAFCLELRERDDEQESEAEKKHWPDCEAL